MRVTEKDREALVRLAVYAVKRGYKLKSVPESLRDDVAVACFPDCTPDVAAEMCEQYEEGARVPF